MPKQTSEDRPYEGEPDDVPFEIDGKQDILDDPEED